MSKKPNRARKRAQPLELARKLFMEGRYRDTRHATDRRSERAITLPEIRQVIETGHNNKQKDEYKPEFDDWNYAIDGRTVDGRKLRIAVAFDDAASMLIITAIHLDR